MRFVWKQWVERLWKCYKRKEGEEIKQEKIRSQRGSMLGNWYAILGSETEEEDTRH